MSALDRDVLGALVTVTPLLGRIGEQLPPLISVNVNASGVSVMPWLPGGIAPLTALLAWAEQLSDVEYHVGRVDQFETTHVVARGLLDGVCIDVVACTYRNIENARATVDGVTVTEQSLRRAAAGELTPPPETAVTA